MSEIMQKKLRYQRSRLADLYEEIEEGEPGSWTTKMSVSDAIDALDKAIASCPREEPANG